MLSKIAPGSPHTYSQLRAEKARKLLNNDHTETVKPEKLLPHEARLSHELPEVNQLISSSSDNSNCTVHNKRKRSNDELSLMVSIKRSKITAPVQIEPGRLKLKKKKKPHSSKTYKISISRALLNRDIKLSSSLLQSSSKQLQGNSVPANDMVDEPVKRVKTHKVKKDKKLLLPVQGLCTPIQNCV